MPVAEKEQQSREKASDLRDDSGNRKQKPDNAPVSRRVATGNPAKRNDGDGLDVADYGTAHGASFVDDVELGYVDHARTEPALYRPSAPVHNK